MLQLDFELLLYLFSGIFFILPSLIKKVVRCGIVVPIWVFVQNLRSCQGPVWNSGSLLKIADTNMKLEILWPSLKSRVLIPSSRGHPNRCKHQQLSSFSKLKSVMITVTASDVQQRVACGFVERVIKTRVADFPSTFLESFCLVSPSPHLLFFTN